jgi:hypothetical protein
VVGDLESAIAIARKIGDPFLEATAINNLAQVLYWAGGERAGNDGPADAGGSLERAAEHAARSRELAVQLWGEADPSVMGAELLMARIEAYRSRYDEAARLVRSIRALQVRGTGQETTTVGWGPAEHLMLEALELVTTSGADESSWAPHAARVAAADLQPEDRLELLEFRATAALRSGRTEQARALYGELVALARQHRNLMSGRVLRDHAGRFGSAA